MSLQTDLKCLQLVVKMIWNYNIPSIALTNDISKSLRYVLSDVLGMLDGVRCICGPEFLTSRVGPGLFHILECRPNAVEFTGQLVESRLYAHSRLSEVVRVFDLVPDVETCGSRSSQARAKT